MTDWIILSAGAFLCFLSLKVLRIVIRTRRSYVHTLREIGEGGVPFLPAQVVMLLAWGAVFMVGCALLVWGWVR
jgi:hypothetical protein